MHQPQHRRYVAHLLYAPPLQRGRCLVIEDMPPLYDVPVQVRLPQTVTSARLEPGSQALPIERAGDAVRVTVPKMQCHQVVVFEY